MPQWHLTRIYTVYFPIIFLPIEPVDCPDRKPKTVTPKTFLKMNGDMQKYVYGSESPRYLREVRYFISHPDIF